MTALKSKKIMKNDKHSLFQDYSWFFTNIYPRVQKSVQEFFLRDLDVRFMGVSVDDNILFYGDEYFVNKVPIAGGFGLTVRISSTLVSSLLDSLLGPSSNKFELKQLTDIEATLLKSFTVLMKKTVMTCLSKSDANKKSAKYSSEYSFTFFVKEGDKHRGKIIISIPTFMIPEITIPESKENFTISDFKTTKVALSIAVGSTKLTLNDVKGIEEGDIIVLEDSNINKMMALWNEKRFSFLINPNPSLIISVDSNGGNQMEEEVNQKSQNMWDSILVDVVAEFDNVKLTLGELKQISEGLVIDVGSVYDNKIKLRVENQVVATGELVILNDRYGVKIDSVKKSNKEATQAPKTKPKPAPTAKPAPAAAAPKQPVKPAQPVPPAKEQNVAPQEGDENFDYSDFEIEDESI